MPARLARLPLDGFLERLPSLDGDWARRVKREAAAGRVLRYLVVATPRSVRAYLAAVPAGSPAGSLSGTRNLVSFTSRRYREEPLVDHRARRGRRSHGRGHPQRHPAARGNVNMEFPA